MQIIIVGDGKVGLAITEMLSREGHDLVIVDSNRRVLDDSMAQYDVMAIHGNGASMPVLKEAGAETADLVIAATSTDEINLLTCAVAKSLGTKSTIARVRTPEYAEQLTLMREDLGLSMPINPELSAATEIYNNLQFPSFLHRDSFARGRVEIVELKIVEGSNLCGTPLHKLYKILSVKVLVCAVERRGEAIIPDGGLVLEAGDRIHVTAETRDLPKVVHAFGLKHQKIHDAMIVGGSRIAFYLSKMLLASGISVKIIERDAKRSVALAEMLPEATVIEADGSHQQVLLAAGIENMDALITLTDLDEVNAFLSLYGSHVGVKRAITKVSRTEFAAVIGEMGIDSAISPKMICAMEVVRYVRAMANTIGGAVLTMHDLVDGKVHALEFRAGAQTRFLDEKLTNVPVRKSILLACIIRRGRTMIPQGNSVIKRGDTVIVVTLEEQRIVDINQIFEA